MWKGEGELKKEGKRRRVDSRMGKWKAKISRKPETKDRINEIEEKYCRKRLKYRKQRENRCLEKKMEMEKERKNND